MEIKKRLEFKNRNIARYQSDFKHGLQRVFTSFKFDKNTQYKGLYLCEYCNGDKHFVMPNRIIINTKVLSLINIQKKFINVISFS